jgi:hypothetical protein
LVFVSIGGCAESLRLRALASLSSKVREHSFASLEVADKEQIGGQWQAQIRRLLNRLTGQETTI